MDLPLELFFESVTPTKFLRRCFGRRHRQRWRLFLMLLLLRLLLLLLRLMLIVIEVIAIRHVAGWWHRRGRFSGQIFRALVSVVVVLVIAIGFLRRRRRSIVLVVILGPLLLVILRNKSRLHVNEKILTSAWAKLGTSCEGGGGNQRDTSQVAQCNKNI